jgi:hypothetical protein
MDLHHDYTISSSTLCVIHILKLRFLVLTVLIKIQVFWDAGCSTLTGLPLPQDIA